MGLCSRCGKRGHNKRTCPTRKKRKAPSGAGAGDGGRPAGGADGDRSQPHVPPPQKRAKRGAGAGAAAAVFDPLQAAIAKARQADAAEAAATQLNEQDTSTLEAERRNCLLYTSPSPRDRG